MSALPRESRHRATSAATQSQVSRYWISMEKQVIADTPLRRLGQPDDIVPRLQYSSLPVTPAGSPASGYRRRAVFADASLTRTHLCQWNVRFGFKADIPLIPADVRFTPKSGHQN